jgi:uncharacterized membrane protein YoaK (UPF0700 family)
MVFRQHAPAWVFLGAFLLAASAGWLNMVGYLGLAHQAISHVTGTITASALAVSQGQAGDAVRAVTVVACFFVGAMTSGIIIGDAALSSGRRYGVALLIESALILAAMLYFRAGHFAGEYAAAAAVGLQNALATSYSGAVIRTTHMTGVVTDLGLAIGHALRRQRIDWMRVRLHAVLLAGFALGAAGGAVAFGRWEYSAMLVPVLVTFTMGASYTTFVQLRRHAHESTVEALGIVRHEPPRN